MKDGEAWVVVLAAGEGERLRPFVERWLGRHLPKQYCTFVGTRSMLQHTVDRADRIAEARRTVAVVGRHHFADAWGQLEHREIGKLILQPANRGTAAGVFLGLTHIRAHDPQATVVVLPSDHFVYPEERWIENVASAIRAAEQMKNWPILLGVSPDHAEAEYGWIQPGARLARIDGHRIYAVEAFLEKPERETCRRAMASGAFWNTLILVGQLETLWTMARSVLSDLIRLFEELCGAIRTSDDEVVLERIYGRMPTQNFSTAFLQRIAPQVAMMELEGVLWSDWGRVDRIVEALRTIGKQPLFPTAGVANAQGSSM